MTSDDELEIMADFRRFHASKAPTADDAHRAFAAVNRPGRDDLWLWFGLSYASWLTLPRVLMHEMPDDWQAKMAALLNEFSDTWTTPEDFGTPIVNNLVNGKFAAWPAWVTNYRHPRAADINDVRVKR